MGVKGVEAVQDAGVAKVSKKILIWSCVALAVVLVVAGVGYWWHQNGTQKAAEAIGKADMEQNDSVRFEMYKKIADDGSFKANERAKLMTAIKYYNDGKYEDALKYLQDASVSSPVIQTGAYSLEGDCYANLGKLDDALDCYNKAVSASDNNPQVAPFVLVKEANIYREQKKYDKEYEAYEKIFNNYPEYVMGLNFDIRKYAERAKAQAGK